MNDKTRLLIVEDEPAIRTGLVDVFVFHGFEVDATTSPDEAIEKAESASYDAALVDLVMPEHNGADLADTLRRKYPGLPIGLMTGYSNSPLIPQFEKSGMAVFKKPILIQDLVDFLQREIH